MVILALSEMKAGVQALFFGLAVLCFVLAWLGAMPARAERPHWFGWNWLALGLALAWFVFFYNALARA